MADITGTEDADKLIGTADSDNILALGGNDTIVGSRGFDRIDGGSGQDIVDFSNIGSNSGATTPFFLVDGSLFSQAKGSRFGPIADYSTSLSNVETIIANPNISGNRITSTIFGGQDVPLGDVDVDLSAERLTYYAAADNSSKSFTVKNFQNITLTDGKNRVKGNDLDNTFYGYSGEYVLLGSKGNDFYSPGTGTSTLDYSNLGSKVTFLIDPVKDPNNSGADYQSLGSVDKNVLGKDTLGYSYQSSRKKIIGTNNQVNTIDARSAVSDYSLNLNLAQNSLSIINTNGTSQQIEVSNFTNAIGTKAADTIVGGNNNSRLVGNGGNDTITGGTGNDTIVGAGAGSRGVGEVDTLTGGGGKDKFILGNTNVAYYLGNGANDYALIKDFNIFQDSLSIGSLQDYSLAMSGNNSVDLYAGKDVNTRDLIAKIQLSSPLATKTTATTKGIMSANSSLGDAATVAPLSSQLNIISGDNAADIIA